MSKARAIPPKAPFWYLLKFMYAYESFRLLISVQFSQLLLQHYVFLSAEAIEQRFISLTPR